MKPAYRKNNQGQWVCPHCSGKMWQGTYEIGIQCHNYACTEKDNWFYNRVGNAFPTKEHLAVNKDFNPARQLKPSETCNICNNPAHYCTTAAEAAVCKYNKEYEVIHAAKQESASNNVDKILDERGSRYGSFQDNASISQSLCAVVREAMEDREKQGRMEPLTNYQAEALEMICHKMARILSGDAYYADNWDDIAGYAQLGKNPR